MITYRVAHLIEMGVPGSAILAVTFTNKAAGGDEGAHRRAAAFDRARRFGCVGFDVSFFLRAPASPRVATLGLPRDFAIYDDDDQTAAVKRALAQLDLSTDDYPPRSMRAQISHAKNHGLTPDEMEASAAQVRDESRKEAAEVFRAYNEILRKACALDFDDLLLRAVELLREHADVRAAWNARFQYLMVDEFQDTNRVAGRTGAPAGGHAEECLRGGRRGPVHLRLARGARGKFEALHADFPDAKIIRLEENYRSTQTILDAAAAVVKNNSDRLGKTLQATLGAGAACDFSKRRILPRKRSSSAARFRRLVRNDPDARVAVLYRTGAQSRSFEEVLRRLGIRYRVVGGFSFYERAEVRNALAYVRLMFHPEDDVALLRVLNVPPRGIGAVTVAALEARAQGNAKSLWDVIRSGEFLTGKKFSGALRSFLQTDRGLAEGMPGPAARAADRARARQHRLSRLGRAAGQSRAYFARGKSARACQCHGGGHRAGPDARRHAGPAPRSRAIRMNTTRRFPFR